MSKSKYNICISVQTTVYYQVSWCSGYHISLTPKRSPVRSRARSTFFCPLNMFVGMWFKKNCWDLRNVRIELTTSGL